MTPGYDLAPQLEASERTAIVRALEAASGHRAKTAQLLGISLRMLYYKMRKLGLR